jgi:hypothetical protein
VDRSQTGTRLVPYGLVANSDWPRLITEGLVTGWLANRTGRIGTWTQRGLGALVRNFGHHDGRSLRISQILRVLSSGKADGGLIIGDYC